VSGSATISGTTLTLSGLGTVTVTVNIAADANYNAATANQTVTINATQTPQPGAFTTFTNPVTQGDMGVVYTVPNVTGTTYTWVYTGGTGVTINGSGNSVTLNFSSTATSGTLSVIAEDGSGPSAPRDMNITVTTLSAISDPFGASLKVYPNPFETTSVIEFDLLTSGEVDVEVYDMLGQRKATLMKGETLGAGSHSITLSDLTSGAYIVKLKVGNKEKNIKVIKN
jgi:ribosomal protein L21E